jgi:hypothetical protein
MAIHAGARKSEREEERHRVWLSQILEQMLGRVDELKAAREARVQAEARYLDSRPVLFPDALAAWDAQEQATRESAVMAVTLAEIEEIEPPAPVTEEAKAERVDRLHADLVESAKVMALEKLVEGERGWRIATDWLRRRAGVGSA